MWCDKDTSLAKDNKPSERQQTNKQKMNKIVEDCRYTTIHAGTEEKKNIII